MDLNLNTIYNNFSKIIKGNSVNLFNAKFMNPWSIVMMCLLLVERFEESDKELILPKENDLLCYLKRMHFDEILEELYYSQEADSLKQIYMPESHNLNIQEILHCKYSDEFNARLGHITSMFQKFGLERNEANLATNIVAELGNNVFDHNLGNWPSNIGGCFLAAQSYPKVNKIEVAIGDPGIGFMGSLKAAFPDLKSDIEAIKKGLEGNTGWIGKPRGNGLKFIQQWTIKNFSGKLIIHSGSGLVLVDKNGLEVKVVNKILGTLVQIVI